MVQITTRHLRRLPLPANQPPYDDELGSRTPEGSARTDPGTRPAPRVPSQRAPVQGALALSVVTGDGLTPASAPRPRLRLVDPAERSAGGHPGTGLPDPRRWAAKLTQAVVEILCRRRPAQQLVRWTDDDVHKALARRVARRSVSPTTRAWVRSVRVCRVSDTVAEASAVVQLGPRACAVALRLEAAGDRWLCTAFEFLDSRAQ